MTKFGIKAGNVLLRHAIINDREAGTEILIKGFVDVKYNPQLTMYVIAHVRLLKDMQF
jgi:hypothetical protein